MQIVDVGANPTEAPSYQPLAEAGLARVTGFEPNPEAFTKLAANTPKYAQYINAAVGLPGRHVFNAYAASEMSSVYKICRKATGFLGNFRRHIGTETEIPMTLSALDDLSAVPRIDLLKIDAQGAECDVIDGAHDKLKDAVAVIAEARFYRIYEGEPLLGDLDIALRKQGFVLHRFVSPKTRMLPNSQFHHVNRKAIASQWIDGDAVYLRSLEEPEDVSDQQLCYLALLASQVFQSHDLALFVLDEMVTRGLVPSDLPARYVAELPQRLRA
ncbi:FkbM family methyltransferase [Planktotalea sp.]|uniref:FkbM family methyltransferase n=1 Tax=Planktotalea sp. TaxID=2029877 RepID=UPI003C75DAF4